MMKISDIISAISFAEPILHSLLEAQVLLAHVLNVSRTYLYTWPHHSLNPQEIERFLVFVERRQQGEPIAYLVEEKEFWSLTLKVTPAVLIPRPETECLVETALAHFPSHDFKSVLELGTGSGAIALALAKERPAWEIWAVDRSLDALSIAEKNARNLSLTQIRFVVSDWFQFFADLSIQFDLIVGNPPYISPEAFPKYEADIRWEPKAALLANEEGLADLKHIIQGATAFLAPNGWLMLEHGFDQASAVAAFMQASDFANISTWSDLAGKPRVTVAQRK
jgi:release factor glutamine methyltransferase